MNKDKKKRWIKFRHRVVFALFRPVFAVFTKLRYNFKYAREEKSTPKNCIIFSNHQTTLDPFMLSLSFKSPIYFMTSDDLFTLGFTSKLIRFLVAPIPKSKSKADLNAIRNTLQVLKEGGRVAIFPEGNRTLSGDNWEIDDSTAKLVKLARVPLVLYKLSGGYGADPRWGGSVRKGKMTGKTVEIIYPEQIEKMSNDELLDTVKKALLQKDVELGWNFKSKKPAEFIERAVYYCPKCKSFNCIYSSGKYILCKECDFTAEYTSDLKIKALNGKAFGDTIEWFNAQKLELEKKIKIARDEILFCDGDVELRVIVERNRKKLGQAEICATKTGVIIKSKTTFDSVEFSQLDGATILGKRKINFYLGDKTFQVKGSKRFNAIKYLHLYQLSKGE